LGSGAGWRGDLSFLERKYYHIFLSYRAAFMPRGGMMFTDPKYAILTPLVQSIAPSGI